MIIVDASVALKWVLPEENSAAARALWQEDLAAPDFWIVELANALWRRTIQKELSYKEAARRLTRLHQAPVRTLLTVDHIDDAFRLAAELEHPVYDCLYLAAAMREGAQLVTADHRFARRIQAHDKYAPYVRILGEG